MPEPDSGITPDAQSQNRIVYLATKRCFDIVVALSGLVLLSPLLLLIALLVKLDSKGPVLYKGRRVGLRGKPFNMLKYRTMLANADRIGGSSTPEDDPRITRFGKFLRRHKLDEIPQLFNILIGQMSVVGPRPQVQWAVHLSSLSERQILLMKPGITDVASVHFSNEGEILKGSKDPDGDYMKYIHREKVRLSLEYMRLRSMRLDLRLIAETVCVILKQNDRDT